MTKSQLIDKVSEKMPSLTKNVAALVVNTIFDKMAESLRNGGRIEIRGFGTFEVRTRRAKEGRNPRTGEKLSVPVKKVPFFKAGKEMRERVDKKI